MWYGESHLLFVPLCLYLLLTSSYLSVSSGSDWRVLSASKECHIQRERDAPCWSTDMADGGISRGGGEWTPFIAMIAIDFAFAIVNIMLKKALDNGMNHLIIITYRLAGSTIFLAPISYFLERYCRLSCFDLHYGSHCSIIEERLFACRRWSQS